MKRTVAWLLLVLMLTGCAAPKPPPAEPPPAGEPPPRAEAPPPPPPPAGQPQRPQQGLWLEGAQLPTGRELVARSPDGQWEVRAVKEQYSIRTLWLETASGERGFFIAPSVRVSDRAPLLWTYRNTLLAYQHYGGDGGQRDTWWEADPDTGQVRPLVPAVLSGRNAGNLRLSPDGRRLLAETNLCHGCNKPSENTRTTYLIDLERGTYEEVGVDVAARWEGDGLVTVARAPRLGYSGMPAYLERDASGALLVGRPFGESFQVGAAESAHWRVYRPGDGPGAQPLHVLPALNQQDTYSTMAIWWPDPPAGPVRLELWAEVRPAVPDDPALWPEEYQHLPKEFRQEGGRRWAVLWSEILRVKEESAPRQTVLLRSARMWDPRQGWGVDWRGRILRTEDGGVTWRDVSPPGHERCDGRLFPQQAEAFAAGRATVAQTCYQTGPDGKWAKETGQVTLFQTVDGGRSWRSSVVDSGYQFASPVQLFSLDEQHGWLLVRPKWPEWWLELGDQGALFRTANGGRTWLRVSDTVSGLPGARDLSFTTPDLGWTVRGDTLFRTEDGGRTWTEQPLPDRLLRQQPAWAAAPQFVDATHGFLTVQGWSEGNRLGLQELYATANGGRTWEKRPQRDGERRPVFLTPQVGYVWEYEARTVYWTRDGGRTWEPYPWAINPAGITDVHFVDEHHGIGVQGHLWQTPDGGRNWHEILPRAAR